jgi:outer membrane protein OmpA-like peptidoglycan-associated protein
LPNKSALLNFVSAAVLFLCVSHFGSAFLFAQKPSEKTGERIYETWEAGGDANGNVYISDGALAKLGLKKNGEAYLINLDSKILLFGSKRAAAKYARKFDLQFWKITEISIDFGIVSLAAYYDVLGDVTDGIIIEEQDGGFAQILKIPEEVKQAKRNMAVEIIIEESAPSGIWELKDEAEKVALTADLIEALGVGGLEKIYIVYYGKRAFLFDDKANAETFFSSLMSVGAGLAADNFKEIPATAVPEKKEPYITPVKPILEKAKVLALKPPVKKSVAEALRRREAKTLKEFSLSASVFKSDGFTLTSRGKKIIKLQADEIKKLKYKTITVEGHTSAGGSRKANLTLSRKRAKSVYDEFAARSIPAKKIKYAGFGGDLPASGGETRDGRLANRRVDVFVE